MGSLGTTLENGVGDAILDGSVGGGGLTASFAFVRKMLDKQSCDQSARKAVLVVSGPKALLLVLW